MRKAGRPAADVIYFGSGMKHAVNISRQSKRPKKKRSKAPLAIVVSAALSVGTVLLVVGALLTTAGVAAYQYYKSVEPQGLTAVQEYEANPYSVSLIQDSAGNTLQQLVNPQLGTRVEVPLKLIPTSVISATIDTENATFWTDDGIDLARILSAARTDVSGNGLQGASTITEQLVKVALYGSNASAATKFDQSGIQKKVKEIAVALGLTKDIQVAADIAQDYPHADLQWQKKATILEMYLNTIPYGSAGGEIDGIEAAAEYFFGIHASQLDLAQSALLAGLPQAPTEYNPNLHYDYAISRQHDVLGRMLTQGDVSQAQYDQAVGEHLNFVYKSLYTPPAQNTSNETYFVQWLLTQYLNNPANLQQFGIPDLQQPDDIYRGFIFQTTLDPTWENDAQQIINDQVAANAGLNMTDGALVAIDPRTNEIKAYVGGVGYNSGINGAQYDMASQDRQAGSSFKPFMYVTAFENGQFPAETIDDAPVSFPQGGGQPPYVPHNYDMAYHGLVTIRTALANSYNVPAVKVMASLGPDGVKKVLATANSMGYHVKNQDPSSQGVAFTLGTDPGPLLEEVNAYAVFANNGLYRPYMPILAIYRQLPGGGKQLLWKYKVPKGVQVMAPQFAYLITDILKDTAAKVPAFGQYAYEYLGLPDRPVASKTGTTSDFKDNLTLGYTPDLVTGVWVGNPNDTPMYGSTGVTGAAPAWHAFMVDSTKGTPPLQFVVPPGIITATVAKFAPAGSLPGLAVNGSGVTDIFAAGSVPTAFDNPAADDYSAAPTATATPGTTATPSANNAPCGGGPYSVTSQTSNGKTIYKIVCQ